MAQLYWDPWREMHRLRDEVNRAFERAWGGGLEEAEFPLLNVTRTPEKVTIEALAPGVDRESLDVTASGDTLTIRGERKADPEETDGRYHRRERESGRFVRAIKLNDRVAADKVAATYRDGVLRIELPFAPEAAARRVTVES